MDYKDLIDRVKNEIDDYTPDDGVFGDIYQKAFDNLKNAYTAESARIAESYRADRNQLAADNALDTKNLSEELAARGLARSGESALLRINQAISLNNALSSLARAKTESEAKLLSEHGKELAELEKTMASEKADMATADKNNLYDRLMQLEKLYADSKDSAADRAAAERKWKAELAADEKEWQAKLENQLLLAGLKSQGSGGNGNSGLGSGTGGNESGDTVNGSVSGNVSSGNGSKDEGITPSVSALTVAKNIVDRYRDKYGNIHDLDKDYIYEELATLIATTNISREYATAILTALKSMGFDENFSVEIASAPYFKEIYDRFDRVRNTQYELRLDKGMNSSDAFWFATDAAKTAVDELLNRYGISKPDAEKIYRMLGID